MESFREEDWEGLMVRTAYGFAASQRKHISYEAVKKILTGGQITEAMTTREFFEIENYRQAYELLMRELASDTKFSITFIKKLHHVLMDRILPDAGQFKASDCTKTKEIAFRLIDWCKGMKTQLKTSATAEEKRAIILGGQETFTTIVPFREGNQQVGQMLMVFLCLCENLEPILTEDLMKKAD